MAATEAEEEQEEEQEEDYCATALQAQADCPIEDKEEEEEEEEEEMEEVGILCRPATSNNKRYRPLANHDWHGGRKERNMMCHPNAVHELD